MITITEELIPTLMRVLKCSEKTAEWVVETVANDIERAQYYWDERMATMIFGK